MSSRSFRSLRPDRGRRKRRPYVALLSASLVALTAAAALAEIPYQRSGTEAIFGTGNVNGVTGNRSMAAGFSPEGELTLLKWPSPSFFDQVSYRTPLLPLEDTTALRASPRNGAAPGDGSFFGIVTENADGTRSLSWTRDPPWTHVQRYASASSAQVVTEATHAGLGLRVTTTDAVLPRGPEPFQDPDRARDSVLVRHVRIERLRADAPERAKLLLYENLAPCRRRLRQAPVLDHVADAGNDFAVLYSEARDALLHFQPVDADTGRLGDLDGANTTEIDALVERIDALYPNPPSAGEPAFPGLSTGIFVAVGLDRAAAEVQAGVEGGIPPLDAFVDASDDGALSGAPAAVGTVNAALATGWIDLAGGAAETTAYFSAAPTAARALAGLDAARAEGPAAGFAREAAWWEAFLARVRLPRPDLGNAADDARAVDVARRALINVWIATDAITHAIVASVTTQPPYGEDWPRDGAFFNHALDQAGLHEVVRRRNLELYPSFARRPGELDYSDFGPIDLELDLAGSYHMNYYADGLPGGPFFFEIDNAAFVAWTFWDHYLFTRDPSYLEQVFPSLATTARMLALCRDDANGLPCPAMEDDNAGYTQTLHGATTVYLALDSALAAARELDRLGRLDPAHDHRQLWRERQGELEGAMRRELLSGDASGGGATVFQTGLGQRSWNLWPTRFPFTGAERRREAQALLDGVAPHLSHETLGASYLAKTTLALAKIGFTAEATGRPGFDVVEAQRRLMVDLPIAGTDQYGETFVTLDTDGDGVGDFYDNRTAIPHVWAATLQYSALMTLFPPGDPEEVSPTPPAARHGGGGGGCGTVTDAPGTTPVAAWILAALVRHAIRGRRKRRPYDSSRQT